jgi:hypothetical protein
MFRSCGSVLVLFQFTVFRFINIFCRQLSEFGGNLIVLGPLHLTNAYAGICSYELYGIK